MAKAAMEIAGDQLLVLSSSGWLAGLGMLRKQLSLATATNAMAIRIYDGDVNVDGGSIRYIHLAAGREK